MSLYLALNIFTIFVPLVLSFDKRVQFFRQFKSLFISIILVGAVFIIWDVYFTKMGVWGFNPDYLIGIDILNLPLEEWLFFITVPYACTFIHDTLNVYFPQKKPFKHYLWLIGAIVSFFILLIFWNHKYTQYTASLNILLCSLAFLKKLDTSVFRTYMVVLIPFFLVNGVLTGFFTEEPVVWYNMNENMGVRIGSIPLDDFFYNFLLIVSVIEIRNFLLKRIYG